MDFSSINDNWLKTGFRLNTNLSEIGGLHCSGLIKSLNHYSMKISNIRIIERVMYEHPSVFRTSDSIKDIMRNAEPVIHVFMILGISDRNCNIRWLILTLNRISEFYPMKYLLETAIPLIVTKFPPPRTAVIPGQIIELEIRTISEAQIQWWKHNEDTAEIVQDRVQISPHSTARVRYQTKVGETGYFYVEVSCNGGIRTTSPWIYVGTDEITEEYRQKYETENKTTTKSCYYKSRQMESSMDIIPSPESDGIKRVALLIGIMNYDKCNIQNLQAPEKDIPNLEHVLLKIGYTTFCFGDLIKSQMIHILEQFSKNCIEENCYVFFYYAGHGSSSNKVDYLQLIDVEMRMSDVLQILLRKRPKVLVTIFDMCRNDINQASGDSKLVEVNIPVHENLLLVMSTLPKQKSYERTSRYEQTSLIMQPLCENLSRFACKRPINLVLTNFLTRCENIDQKPIISGVGMPDIIGIDLVLPRFKPHIQWMNIPENQEILKYITVDFRIFHNILNIYVNQTKDQKLMKILIELRVLPDSKAVQLNPLPDGTYKINFFHQQIALRNGMALLIDLCIVNDIPQMHITRYTIKVTIPREIIPFVRLP